MKKSIAVLLTIAFVLTSFFTVNFLTFAEDTPTKLANTGTGAPAAWDNQGSLLKNEGSVTQVTLHSDEALYKAGYTAVSKYVYAGTTTDTDYKKQLSPKRALSAQVDISATRDTTYLRAFIRVPQDTKIKFWLATDWTSKDSVTVDVKSVNKGAGYAEVVVPLSSCTNTETFKHIFVGLADYDEAAKVKQIYVSAVEVWSGMPTAVLSPEEASEPQWLASTNGYIQIEANQTGGNITQYPLSHKTQNAGNSYNKYWQSNGESVYTDFNFESKDYEENYYSLNDSKREIRFAFSTKTEAYVSQTLITDSKIDLSKLPSTVAISVWVKAPVNMKLAIGLYTSDYNRYLKEVSVCAVKENGGWQQIVIPVSSLTTGWEAKILGSIIVRPVYNSENMPEATRFGCGDVLSISRPQLINNAVSTLADTLATDTVKFENEYMGMSTYFDNQSSGKFSNGISYVKDMSGVDASITEAGYAYFRTATINSTFYDGSFGRNTSALGHNSFKNGSTAVDTSALIRNGYIRFFVHSPRDITLTVYLLNGWSDQSTVDVQVKANTYKEVVIKFADLGRTAQVSRVMVGPSSAEFTNQTLQEGDILYYTPVQMFRDASIGSRTADNTITAEQTDDASDAENGFTGLRKLTVSDSGFYTLADSDRAVTHTFNAAVKQEEVDYLGFWVKAPKAMALSLTFTDSYGTAVTADVAVKGTLKQGGYRFVTVPRGDLRLNYLSDIVSLTLTPAADADGFLGEGEALLYSSFTLYSGKPVSFYASYKNGDANGDGTVDICDLVRGKKAFEGTMSDYTYAVDAVEDGVINNEDIAQLRNLLLTA